MNPIQSRGTGQYFERLDVLNNKFGKDDFPDSLKESVFSYTPGLLRKLLEVDKQKRLGKENLSEEDELLAESSVWSSASAMNCTLMLADVSGFCKISEELGRQGVEGLDKLRKSINDCFSSLIGVISQHGGDILNFAGDALIIVWTQLTPSSQIRRIIKIKDGGEEEPATKAAVVGRVSSKRRGQVAKGRPQSTQGEEVCPITLEMLLQGKKQQDMPAAVRQELEYREKLLAVAGIQCGLQLALSEPMFDTSRLSVHVGIVQGPMSFYLCGGESMEFQFISSGSLFEDLGPCVSAAKAGECCISQNMSNLVQGFFEVQAVPDFQTCRKVTEACFDHIDRSVEEFCGNYYATMPSIQRSATMPSIQRLQSDLSDPDSLGISAQRTDLYKALAFIPPPPELDIDSPSPQLTVEPSIREATVVFIKLDGPEVDKALGDCAADSLAFFQSAIVCAQKGCHTYNAMMRQFLVDDKGMVMILVLGVPRCAHTDDPLRGLLMAHEICDGLGKLGIITFAGVTTGQVYVGTVGNRARREYALVADTVNLSARLMSFGCKLHFETFSNDWKWPAAPAMSCMITDQQTMMQGTSSFLFRKHQGVKIKGKGDMDVFEVSASTKSFSSNDILGFRRELAYLRALLVNKERRRRLSYISRRSQRGKFPIMPEPDSNAEESFEVVHLEDLKTARGLDMRINDEDADLANTMISEEMVAAIRKEEERLSEAESEESPGSDHGTSGTEEKNGDISNTSSGEGRREAKRTPSPRRGEGLKFREARLSKSASSMPSSSLSFLSSTAGRLVVIKGSEGGGKSTLLKSVCSLAGSCGLICLLVKLKPADHYQPYAALSQIFKNFCECEELRSFTPQPSKSLLAQVMDEWMGNLNPKEIELVPEIKRTILKIDNWNIAGWVPGTELHRHGTESHELIQDILLKLLFTPTFSKLYNLSVVLAVDNVNYMDSCSWAILVQIIADSQILIICTGPAKAPKHKHGRETDRREQPTDGSNKPLKVYSQRLCSKGGDIHTLCLSKLSPDEVKLLLMKNFPDEVNWSEEDKNKCVEAADGHPLVAIETARTLRLQMEANGAGDGNSELTEVDVIKSLTKRIDSLSIPAQRCLKAASVIGDEFAYETLIEVVPRAFLRLREDKTTQLESIMRELTAQQFIRVVDERTDLGKKTVIYEFCHARLRTTCYNLLLKADQAIYHKQVATWIQTRYQDDLRKHYVPLMVHLFKGNDFDKGADYAVGSIKESVTSGAFGECRVILDEIMRCIEHKKFRPRTVRMVFNTLTHVLKVHVEHRIATEQVEVQGNETKRGETSASEASGKASARLHFHSTRALLEDETHNSSAEQSSSSLDRQESNESNDSGSNPFSSAFADNSKALFRGNVKNHSKSKAEFWEYLASALLTLERELNPAPEGKEEPKSVAESSAKMHAAHKAPTAAATRVCSIQ